MLAYQRVFANTFVTMSYLLRLQDETPKLLNWSCKGCNSVQWQVIAQGGKLITQWVPWDIVYFQPMKKPEETSSKLIWTRLNIWHILPLYSRFPKNANWVTLILSPPAFCRNSSSLLLVCSSTSLHWMEWSYCCPNILVTPTAPFHLAFIGQVLLLREDHWATERPKNWERGRPEIRELELNYTVSSEGCTNRSSSTVVPIHTCIILYQLRSNGAPV